MTPKRFPRCWLTGSGARIARRVSAAAALPSHRTTPFLPERRYDRAASSTDSGGYRDAGARLRATALNCANPPGERLRTLWAAVVAARELGASDIVQDQFLKLARETGLVGDLGRNADADLRHVIRWAMIDQNPFQ